MSLTPALQALVDRVNSGLRGVLEHWPASTGAALALLLAMASHRTARPTADVAAVALAVLSLGLLAALVLASRATLRRERRLVDQSASLRLRAAHLEDVARQDAVTGIANRRALTDDLTAEVYRASRYGRSLSVLMLDIDHFKDINDTHGHQFGDAVLASTAATLKRALRSSDSVARYDGEEFVVILPETPLEAAALAADKLRRAIEANEVVRGHMQARVSISVGAASLHESHLSASEAAQALLATADGAVHAAKAAGRNRVVTALEVEALAA